MNRKSIVVLIALFSFISNASIVFAHCPLCTAATGAAVAVTRWYGIDDIVVGSFIGAFIISTGLWFNNILRKKNKSKDYIPFQTTIVILLVLISTIVSFYLGGLTSPYTFFGIDKLNMGILFGTGSTLFTFWFSKYLIKKMGKVIIPFQSIILTLAFLVLMNLGFYLTGLIQ